MEDPVLLWTDRLAGGIELFAAVIIGMAAVKAIVRGLIRMLLPSRAPVSPEQVRLDLGRWLALGLEFLLGADILRTAAAPSWNDIGQLAAIAVLRTALNYFLEKEIAQEEARERSPDG
ncbi:MAG TPA: DUF1622 domain-containing protein [Pantanalinema sp.]